VQRREPAMLGQPSFLTAAYFQGASFNIRSVR
jgi:hypothetical protein